jgi:hypothetical protein
MGRRRPETIRLLINRVKSCAALKRWCSAFNETSPTCVIRAVTDLMRELEGTA